MCQFCESESCSGQCRNGWPFNRPFYNPPYTTPFNEQCRPYTPPVLPRPCPECGPCVPVGCLNPITTDCVFTTNAYSCFGTSVNTNLTTILGIINATLCSISSSGGKVVVNSSDVCLDYLINKITSSSITITPITDPVTGCVTLDLEAPGSAITIADSTCQTLFTYAGGSTIVPKKQTIYLNSNQNGTNNYSVTPVAWCNGDVVVDFDGRASFSTGGAAPAFDFNVKGNRKVYVDPNTFGLLTYSNTPGSYQLTPPKKYLGNALNASNYDDITYEVTILLNSTNATVPGVTTCNIYLGATLISTTPSINWSGSGGIGEPVQLTFKATLKRLTNTTGAVNCVNSVNEVVVGSSGGLFVTVTSTAFFNGVYTTYTLYSPVGGSFDTDPATINVVLQGSSATVVTYQIIDSKITLNKF